MSQIKEQLSVEDTLLYLHTLVDRLPMFVVTDHPTDFPDDYCARLHLSLPRPVAMPFVITDPDLERLRDTLEGLGLVHLDRSPGDDPVVLEVWV
jgi:hypothetical protein